MNHEVDCPDEPVTFNVSMDDDEDDDDVDDDISNNISDEPSISQYLLKTCDIIAIKKHQSNTPSAQEVARCIGAVVKPSTIDPDIRRTISRDKGLDDEFRLAINTFEDRSLDSTRSTPPITRSISLKPYRKSCASSAVDPTPSQRKTVRFADALGLDLACVRHISDPTEPPIVPASVREALHNTHRDDVAFWRINFPPPVSSSADFLQKVCDRNVLLESCSVNNRDLRVHGIVRVLNIEYEKRVTVRYTTNNWKTYCEVIGRYVDDQIDNDQLTDRFYFFFTVPSHLSNCDSLEFAVRYQTAGETYWDSNYGYNYSLECMSHQDY